MKDRELCPYCKTSIPDERTFAFEFHVGGDCYAIRSETLAKAAEVVEELSSHIRPAGFTHRDLEALASRLREGLK